MEILSKGERADFAALTAGDADGVVFDGAGFGGGGTRIAMRPSEVLMGNWNDWGILSDALQEGKRRGKEGGLAGWFDYEGNFRFGVFDTWGARDVMRTKGETSMAPVDFLPTLGKEEWIKRVQCLRDYIAAGDIYQANLTHALTALWSPPDWAFYCRLCAVSPAPYSCFLRLGDTTVLSASPECFLRLDGLKISTEPIKGTRPRSIVKSKDAALARELITSEKERAELVMITDLERNDLGQICDYGSVRVSSLCRLKSFAQVHHLVSTVEGRLRSDVTPLQAVRACFPGGSITGAPKKRAREIIAEVESRPRGIYTGALGWFDWSGRAAFNIAIRTLVLRQGQATFGIGAGIVTDSDPAMEYEETLHKAAGLLEAVLEKEKGI